MRVPKGWQDVTIRKYYEYHTLITKFKDIDALDLEIKIISCLCNTSEDEVLNVTTSQLNEISKKLEWLKEMPSSSNIPIRVKIKGDTYKASILFSDMKAVQFRHFSEICKGVKVDDYVYQMHNLIASMMSKKKLGIFVVGAKVTVNKYEYDGYEDTASLLLDHMTIDKAYPYYVFFCKVMENLSLPIQDFLIKKLRKELRMLQKKEGKKVSKSIGAGSVCGIL